jgi:hypothetical protein
MGTADSETLSINIVVSIALLIVSILIWFFEFKGVILGTIAGKIVVLIVGTIIVAFRWWAYYKQKMGHSENKSKIVRGVNAYNNASSLMMRYFYVPLYLIAGLGGLILGIYRIIMFPGEWYISIAAIIAGVLILLLGMKVLFKRSK